MNFIFAGIPSLPEQKTNFKKGMLPSENPPCTPAETERDVLQEISDASVNLSEDYASLEALLEELQLWIDYAAERGVDYLSILTHSCPRDY